MSGPHGTTRRPPPVRIRWTALPLLTLTLAATLATPATASPATAGSRSPVSEIVLPGATSAEGIARGDGSTFYAGDLFLGDIYRGDVRRGRAALFVDAPAGRQAVGMSFDGRHDLLFVAGGFTGQAYVYDTDTGATVASYQLGAPGSAVVNDVVITRTGAWFTDSSQAVLYFVPISRYGVPGAFRSLPITGPASDTSSDFNINGIQASPDGRTLLVAHSGLGQLFTIDPRTGASATVAGVSVPGADGLVLDGCRLWVMQPYYYQVSQVRLNHSLTSGVVTGTITSELFQIPTTGALFGDTLAVVNAKFDTGVPPTADEYEVVLVPA